MATVIGNLRAVLGLDSTSFQQGLRSASQSLKKTGADFRRVGRNLSVTVTAPLAGFAALSIRTAADFQKSMNQVAAVSGATGDELAALRMQARELGATTQFSASQAADAMNFLAMAGLKTNEILGAMPDTLKLAAAAQLDMGTAADIVTNIMAGYGLQIEELGHANDVLVKAFTSANTDLRMLAEAMKYAGPVASAAGVEFEEAAAAIGLMGNAGIQGSMAGTSLRGAIARILSPTKSMRAAMEAAGLSGEELAEAMEGAEGASENFSETMVKAGLSFTDAHGRILPLVDIIEQLEPHADDAGLMMELFGQRAGPAMAALVSQGSEALRDLTAELEDSAGTADRVSAVQMEGFTGAMRALRSAFEDLQIAIADSGLLDFVTELVKRLTALVARVGKTNPEILKWGTIIAAAAAAVGPLLIGIGLTVTALGTLAPAFAAVTAAVAGITAPFALAAAAIATAAVAIYNNWDDVGPWLGGVFSAIGQQASGLADVIWGVVTGDMSRAVDGLKDIWAGFGDFWRLIWKGIKGTLTWAWDVGIKPVLDYLGWTDTIVAAWESMRTALGSTIEYIGEKLEWLMGFLQPVLDGLSWLRDKGAGVVDGIGGAAGRAWGGIRGLFSSDDDMVDGLAAGTESAGAQGAADAQAYEAGWRRGMGIQSPSTVMQQIGQFAMQGLGLGVAEGIPSVEGPARELGATIKDRLANSLQGVIEGTMSLKEAFRNMLQDMASSLLSSGLKSAMDAVFGGLFGGNTFSIPGLGGGWSLPGFATGTAHFRGGMATLHERGGELAIMPSGSTVIPHDLSKRMLEGDQSDAHINMTASQLTISDDGRIMATVRAEMARGLNEYDRAMPARVRDIQTNKRRR